jgi:putative phosphoesterase
MRIAIIADIHGNLPALEAVLENLAPEQPEQIVCLGDVAAMGPYPVETLERVRNLGSPVVMGNADAGMLEQPSDPVEDENARRFREMDRWCAEQLAPEHFEYIRTFQPTIEVAMEGDGSLLCYHGSPRSYNDTFMATTPDEDLEPMLDGRRATVMAGGHWHFQMLRRFKDMILFNPGSVGLPYEFTPDDTPYVPSRAEYGLITVQGGTLRIEHRRLSYDSSTTIAAMHERGMPHADWWASNWR